MDILTALSPKSEYSTAKLQVIFGAWVMSTLVAVAARDEDKRRVDAYVEQCLDKFVGFRIPVLGRQKRAEAERAMKNFYRNPGTNLYDTMKNRTDTYRVVAIERTA